jgi:hypothetical protein
MDLPLRASNEGSHRPRVARAQKIIRLHPSSVLQADSVANGLTLRQVWRTLCVGVTHGGSHGNQFNH